MTLPRRTATAVLVAGLCLTGCGSTGHPATVVPPLAAAGATTAAPAGGPPARADDGITAVDELSAAVRKVDVAGTARIDATIATSVAGAHVSVKLSGVEQWKPTLAARLTMSGLAIAGQSVGAIKMIMTPKAIYMDMPLLTRQTHKTWAELSFAALKQSSGVDVGQLSQQAQQLEPGQYVAMLTRSGNVTLVGSAKVDGVATQHYSGTVDVGKAVAALSPQLRSAWAKLSAAGASTERVDVWVDAQGRPRLVKVAIGSSASTASAASTAGLTMSVTLHLSDYGLKVDVAAPPASQTVDLANPTATPDIGG